MEPVPAVRSREHPPNVTAPADVVVIVPTYNEIDTIEGIAASVRRHGYRLLIVDDASPDGTGERVDALTARDRGVSVLHRDHKAGLGRAYAAGFAQAQALGGKIFCEMDADFSHDPADLPRLVEAIDGGADVAIGSRYVPGGGTEGWPWHRKAISKGGNRYASLMLGIEINDATAGFRAFRADAVRVLDPGTCEASGYAFQVEMTWRARRAGLRIAEVPIVFRERTVGSSKMSTGIAVEAMRLVTRWGWQARRERRVSSFASHQSPVAPHEV